MDLVRYAWIVVIVVVGLLGIGNTHAGNGAYPTRPLRLIAPFSAGGIQDFVARSPAEDAHEPRGGAIVLQPRMPFDPVRDFTPVLPQNLAAR